MNLGALLHALDEKYLDQLRVSGKMVLSEPFNMTPHVLLDFDQQLKELSDNYNLDYDYSLDLKRSIDYLKKSDEGKLMRSNLHIKHLAWHAKSANSTWVTTVAVLIIISVMIVIVLYFCLKRCKGNSGRIKTFFTALSLPLTTGYELHHVLNPTEAAPKESTNHPLHEPIVLMPLYSLAHTFQFLAICFIMYICYKIWRKFLVWCLCCTQKNTRTFSSKVHFSIWNSKGQVFSFCMARLPTHLYSSNIQVTHLSEDLDISITWLGCFPVFHWNEDSLILWLVDVQDEIRFPKKILLNPFVAMNVARLLKSTHYAQVVIEDKKDLHCLATRVYKKEDASAVPNFESPPTESAPSGMYPDLSNVA